MIIVSSQRGGAKALGLHLMNAQDNEHIAVHEIRGFVSDDVVSAFKEAQAVAKGTKCKQFLFSCSFNPPEREQADIAAFERAIARLEERTGLTGQPRVIVLHEKEGRRHAHAVWSRIDAETMTAKQLSFSKQKCMEVSREMYLEQGWQMPRGMMSESRDPRNFTLAEWQQAKRTGFHARDLKDIVQECWAASDSRAAFTSALEERGMKLARGDRRGHVIVTHQGEVLSVARYTDKKTKEVRERLGDPKPLPSVEESKAQFVRELTPRAEAHLREQAAKEAEAKAKLDAKRQALTASHRAERVKVERLQRQRWEQETRERSERINKGLRGLWDRLCGQRAKIDQQNNREAHAALQRDRAQQQRLIYAQLGERQRLQDNYRQHRAKAVKERLEIHRRLDDLRKGRLEPERPKPKLQQQTRAAKPAFTKANRPQAPPSKEPVRQVQRAPERQPASKPQERLSALRQKSQPERSSHQAVTKTPVPSTQDRLSALRSKRRDIRRPSRGDDGLSFER